MKTIVACGALAVHVKAIAKRLDLDVQVQPLPALLHNRPELIAPAMREALEGREVVAVRGDSEDVFSRGFICPKAYGIKQLHEDPDRLTTPLVRRDGQLVEATWDEATRDEATGDGGTGDAATGQIGRDGVATASVTIARAMSVARCRSSAAPTLSPG